MKILLDECVDRRLARELAGHEVKTVPQMGWAGIKNGELLTLAEKEFEAVITVDRNLSFQLNLPRYDIAVIVLRCRNNRLQSLLPLVPKMLSALPASKPGEVRWIDAE